MLGHKHCTLSVGAEGYQQYVAARAGACCNKDCRRAPWPCWAVLRVRGRCGVLALFDVGAAVCRRCSG